MTKKQQERFNENIRNRYVRTRYEGTYQIYDTFNEWWSDYPFNEEEHRIPCRAAWKAAVESVLKQKIEE